MHFLSFFFLFCCWHTGPNHRPNGCCFFFFLILKKEVSQLNKRIKSCCALLKPINLQITGKQSPLTLCYSCSCQFPSYKVGYTRIVYLIHENKLTCLPCTTLQKPCIAVKGSHRGFPHLKNVSWTMAFSGLHWNNLKMPRRNWITASTVISYHSKQQKRHFRDSEFLQDTDNVFLFFVFLYFTTQCMENALILSHFPE